MLPHWQLFLSGGFTQVEAVENHMPEIIMVDEIGTEAEALACRTIAERGVQLVATAHGQLLENLIKNPTLSDLVGGIQSVTLGMTTHAKCTTLPNAPLPPELQQVLVPNGLCKPLQMKALHFLCL